MTVSEHAVRQACRREHEAILRCCREEDRPGAYLPALQEDLAHHSLVLYVLRDYLAREYHRALHCG